MLCEKSTDLELRGDLVVKNEYVLSNAMDFKFLTLQSDSVLLDGCNGIIGNDSLACLKNRRNADLFPLNWDLIPKSRGSDDFRCKNTYVGRGVDVLNGLADLRSNAFVHRSSNDAATGKLD